MRYAETLHSDGMKIGKINYTAWSDVYGCPECSREIIRYSQACNHINGAVEFMPEFKCPHCNCLISKNPPKNSSAQKPIRLFESSFDPVSRKVEEKQKQVPVFINYSIETKRYEKLIDMDDLQKALSINLKADYIQNIPFS